MHEVWRAEAQVEARVESFGRLFREVRRLIVIEAAFANHQVFQDLLQVLETLEYLSKKESKN